MQIEISFFLCWVSCGNVFSLIQYSEKFTDLNTHTLEIYSEILCDDLTEISLIIGQNFFKKHHSTIIVGKWSPHVATEEKYM